MTVNTPDIYVKPVTLLCSIKVRASSHLTSVVVVTVSLGLDTPLMHHEQYPDTDIVYTILDMDKP